MKTSAPCKEGFGHARDGETPARDASDSLLDVRAVAGMLGVSASWVRRHASQLPCVRVGRMVRFDSSLLFWQLQAKMQGGKPLKPERTDMFFRYQRGFVYQKGRKVKVWYGRIRENVRNPDGQIERRHRNIRLRELSERWEKAEGSTMKTTTLHHYKNALRATFFRNSGIGKSPKSTVKISKPSLRKKLASTARALFAA